MEILKSQDLKKPTISVLIYGTPGMGKTTLLGSQQGRTLIIDIDRGTNVLVGCENVDVVRVSENVKELQEILRELQENCDYDNVCLDSLSELERSILTTLSIRNGTGSPSLQDYTKTNNYVLNCCRQLRGLQANVMFTAWEKCVEITAPSGEKYTRLVPMLRDKNMENICGLCDIVGRIYTDRETGERKVWLEGRPEVIAKDRIYKRKCCKFEEVLNGGGKNAELEI
ncbi:MAG: AAA family ATPase [Synergistaceae bacterium]|nr:AAA family ATPase [Synergistaceae bacterium]